MAIRRGMCSPSPSGLLKGEIVAKKFPHKSLAEHLQEFTPQDRYWLVILGNSTRMISDDEAAELLGGTASEMFDLRQRYAFAIQALLDRFRSNGTTVVDDLARAVRR